MFVFFEFDKHQYENPLPVLVHKNLDLGSSLEKLTPVHGYACTARGLLHFQQVKCQEHEGETLWSPAFSVFPESSFCETSEFGTFFCTHHDFVTELLLKAKKIEELKI